LTDREGKKWRYYDVENISNEKRAWVWEGDIEEVLPT